MRGATDDVISATIASLMETVDIETMTTNQFIALLSERMDGCDLSHKKKFIKKKLIEIVNSMAEQDMQDEPDESNDIEEEKAKASPKKRKLSSSKSAEKIKKPKAAPGKGGGGLQAPKEISDALADFCGQGKVMPRTAVVKHIWEYIREHKLQNPDNKREILLDQALQRVFKVETFTMFTMHKYIGSHMDPYPPVRFDTEEEKEAKRAAKEAKRKADKKNGKGNKKTKRKAGTQTPYRLSAELAAVVDAPILPRPQVTQGLWKYIRAHNLQNPECRSEILCDDRMRKVMGGEAKVTMFSMNRYVTSHLIEKVDRAEYVHKDQEDLVADETDESE